MSNYFELFRVVNVSIAASWLVLAVLLLRKLLKKVPKWLHVGLWGLVALRLVVPFSLESAFSLIPSAETLPEKVLRYEGEQRRWPVEVELIANEAISDPVTIVLNQDANRVQVKHVYLTLAWWGGMGMMFLYGAISFVSLRLRMRTAVRMEGNVYRSERVGMPFILGVFRPRIYVPCAIGEGELVHVIAHEEAHIDRKDHWWKLLGFLLLSVHWFNPLMWVAYVFLCRDIELACDEKVVKNLEREQRADYSQALLSLGVSRRRIAACPLAFGEVGVKERIRNVISYKKPAFWLVIVAVVMSAVVALCFLTNPVTGKDKLTVFRSGISNNAGTDIGSMELEAVLGDKVKSGRLYVEQWYEGICEQSIPAILTQDLTYLSLVMRGNEQGYSVTISTNEFGGEWESYFSVPYDETVKSWSLAVAEEGQELSATPGGESILCTLHYDNGRQFVVRAVWSKEKVWSEESDKEKDAESVRPYYMKMFRIGEEIETKNPARKEAYVAALEQLIYQRKAPDGETWMYGMYEFAVLDIDGDGGEELIIRENQGAMASMNLTVYDYDESTRELRKELSEFPSVRFYENGVVVADVSHNQGPASGAVDFWPYCVYHYDKELDKYEYVAYVEGWYNSSEREMYEGNAFPKEADLNGDGMVYYIMPQGYALENPIDNAAYKEWRDSAVGEAEEITFFFQDLPKIRVPAAG